MKPDGCADFESCSAEIETFEQKFKIRLLKMNGSILLFVANAVPECVDEIGLAMANAVDTPRTTISTTILGEQIATRSQLLAEKLSKRFNRQFIVSFNAKIDRLNEPMLESALIDYLKSDSGKATS